MSHRKILVVLLGLVLLGLGVGLIFFPGSYSFCRFFQSCTDSSFLILNVGHPLVVGLIPLIPILFILLFFSKEIFNTWKKFAIFLIPLSIILIIITPVYCHAPLNLCFNKILTTRFTSIGFSILSLIIIIYKIIRLKLAKRKASKNLG